MRLFGLHRAGTAWVMVLSVLALLAGVVSVSIVDGPRSPAGPAHGPAVAAAPNAAAAVRLARAQGSRVEVVDQRTETRTVYAEPKGTFTAELTLRPVRVRRAAGWATADPTLVRRADGSIGPRVAAVDLSFSAGGAGRPMVRLGRDATWFALSWGRRLPVPELSGDTATYRNVLPGVDLLLRAEVNGYAQYLVVRNAAAARNPALRSVVMGLRTAGASVRATPDGALQVRDHAGRPVFAAPPSQMWDATQRHADVAVAADARSLTLRPDQGLLTGRATRYPVTVDPVFTTISPSVWAKVFSGYPDMNYLNGNNDVDAWAKVGYCWPGWGNCNGIGVARSYFQFDTRWMGGVHVLDATLTARAVYSPSGTSSFHRLFQAGGTIDQTTTWRNQPTGLHLDNEWVPCVGRSGCGAYADVGFFVGTFVHAGGVSTYYLQDWDESGNTGWRKYDPWATKLTIRYNRAPDLPSELSTDPPLPAACTWCGGRPYINDAGIRLKARLSDPDGDQVRPFWRLFVNGALQDNKEIEGPYKASGEIHDLFVDQTNRDGQALYWEMYANDGWDSRGYSFGPAWTVDRTAPGIAPGVTSGLYQSDNRWHGGVGVPGTFTFDSAGVGDVDHFVYGFTSPPTTKVDADRLGGAATVSLEPPGDGPRDLFVQSVDRAGNPSPVAVRHFYVRPGSGPLAQWSFEGNGTDEAYLGDRDATPAGSYSYVPGAVGSAIRLDGGHVNAPNTLRTDESFSVSAWVKPEASTGTTTVAAQDGVSRSAFRLSYVGDVNKWELRIVSSDTASSYPASTVRSAEPVQAGRWTHLVGVYDRTAKEIRLYVNGVLSGRAAVAFTPTTGTGAFSIGRSTCSGSPCGLWRGSIDEVKSYDRVLTAEEIHAAVRQDGVQAGVWKFDELSGATARNAAEGGEMLALQGGASFTGDSNGDRLADGGAVGGALRLDGTSGFAATSGPVVRTDQTFSVAAWLNTATLDGSGENYPTAVSADGGTASAFYIRHTWNPTPRWFFTVVSTDGDTASWVNLFSTSAAQAGVWTHVAVTYQSDTKKARLYINGRQEAELTVPGVFAASGPLVVGRARWQGQSTGYWRGLVDDVRVFSRVLDVDEIQGVLTRDSVAVASWKFDGTTDGPTPAQRGTPAGNVSWTAGQTDVPDQTDLAVQLDGVGAQVSLPHSVNATQSLSVAAWARLDKLGGLPAVLSQDGSVVSAFKLRATPQGRWSFAMFGDDVTNGGARAEVQGGAAQVGVWTHLVASYDAAAHRISLYVNGVLAGTATWVHDWDYAPGGLQVGRARWNGGAVEFFPGAVDDVAVYSRVLFADEIRVLAGRDLTLADNWRLDEPSGTTATDAVGSRPATLSGGTTRVPGRIGNALQFDGVSGQAATTGIDVRTENSFTVSAWVYLARTCDPGTAFSCELVAVSQDGTGTSKFRLGHLVDGDHPDGVWVFEMPESDTVGAVVTKAAVTILPSDLNNWVHLAGVYDRTASKLWLYVNGTRKGDGTLLDPWPSTRGVLIGRGRGPGGTPDQFFAGKVDDVRLYNGLLDDARIENLYRSYLTRDTPATLPVASAGRWALDETTGTTASDASGRGLTATLRNTAGWTGDGRVRGALLLPNAGGAGDYAETAGPVLDTTRSFSVAAWIDPAVVSGTDRRVVFGQDGGQNSVFQVAFEPTSSRFQVVVPTQDAANAAAVVVTSTHPAFLDRWFHLTVSYDATLRQVRLYVNGVLSAVQTGITVLGSTGPFTIGRAKVNGAPDLFFPGRIDDVRAFSQALSDGQVRAVHDDAPANLMDLWRFDDGTTRAYSPRGNNATTTATGVSFVPGVSGLAMQLDGTAGRATAAFHGVSQRDSFTVSAWVNLAHKNQVATVLSQDGVRASSIVLQYRPNLDRWVFGQPTQDADAQPLVYAYSAAPAVQGEWTHLVGVYDHPAHELRLYVNGALSGTKRNVTLWVSEGRFVMGRDRNSGLLTDLFPGLIDEVRTDLGAVPDAEIARRATQPSF